MDSGEGAPWWLTSGLFAAWCAREVWAALRERRKVRTETDANVELINSLRASVAATDDRLRAMAADVAQVTQRLEEEIKLRREVEEEAHQLRMRVHSLESTLRGLGAVIPSEVSG